MNLNFLLAHYLLRKKKIIHLSFEMPISAKCNYNNIENHSLRTDEGHTGKPPLSMDFCRKVSAFGHQWSHMEAPLKLTRLVSALGSLGFPGYL